MLRSVYGILGLGLLGAPCLAEMTVTFIDAGQADAAVVQIGQDSGEPFTIVVDAGYDALEHNLGRLLAGDSTVELLVLSKPHSDHVGGFNWLLTESDIVVERVWWNEGFAENDDFRSFVIGLQAKGIVATRPEEGVHYFSLAGPEFAIRVLNDGKDFPDTRGHFQNNNSLVFQVLYESTTGEQVAVLFTGDITEDQGELLVNQYGDELQSDVIKVPHHGSEKVFPEFATRVAASLAFVSASGDHETPRRAGLDLYDATAEIYCTCDAAGESSNLVLLVDDLGNISTTPSRPPPYFVWEEDPNGGLRQIVRH